MCREILLIFQCKINNDNNTDLYKIYVSIHLRIEIYKIKRAVNELFFLYNLQVKYLYVSPFALLFILSCVFIIAMQQFIVINSTINNQWIIGRKLAYEIYKWKQVTKRKTLCAINTMV